MNPEEFQRKLTAILSADVQGYSRLMGENEDSTVRALTACRALMSSLTQNHRGHVVDTTGDNLLAKFGSVMDAVRCAVEIQEELRIMNAELPENRKMQFRIGINLGDVIEEGGHIYGDGINVASRIEGLAEGGGICISGTVYDAIKNKLSMSYQFMGEHSVKNIKDPVRVYRVRMEPDAAAPMVKEKAAKSRTWQRIAYPIVAIFVLGAVAAWLFSFRQTPAVSDVEETPKTIAVLPFDDLSPEKDQEYFVLGLSEEILNSLAQIADLTVIAKTSSFSFKDKDRTIQDIAGILGVDNILEGSVRKAGNALRITAQLINAVDGSHLWSNTYDREFNVEEMFSVQEDIAAAVANELKATLNVGESLKRLGETDNREAYALYLVAIGATSSSSSSKDPLVLINAAIELDPKFALAWSLKSLIHWGNSMAGPTIYAAAEQDASLNAALRAIELQPALSEGYASLGTIKATMGELIEAELAFEKVSNWNMRSLWATAYINLLHDVAYFKKAQNLLEEARRVDPLNFFVRITYIENLIYLGNLEQAEKENERCMETFGPDWWGNLLLFHARIESGQAVIRDQIALIEPFSSAIHDAAIEHLESPKEGLSVLRRFYNEAEKMNTADLTCIACWAVYFGDLELAMDSIEKAVCTDTSNINVYWGPLFKELRQRPRFKKLVREIGLVGYWNRFGWPDICRPLNNGDFVCD